MRLAIAAVVLLMGAYWHEQKAVEDALNRGRAEGREEALSESRTIHVTGSQTVYSEEAEEDVTVEIDAECEVQLSEREPECEVR